MSITTELWANPAASTTVSSGGTTAPAQGTSQSWTMAGGYASFPAANSSATPLTQFHVIDPALPTEIMAVTNVSGATWTVTRGAEGTTPVAHAAGFTVQQVVTAGGLDNLLQAPQSGNGLALPNGTITGILTAGPSSTATLTAGQLSVPAGEAVPGSVYEIEAWGSYTSASSNTVLTLAVTWGGVSLGSNAFTMPTSQTVARWRFKCSVSILAGPLAGADCRLELAPTNAAGTAVSVYLFGANSSTGVSVTTSSTETLAFTLTWTTSNASNIAYVIGSKVWKSA